MPTGITATPPGALASQQTGNVSFTLSTTTAGVVRGSASLSFASHDFESAVLSLASQDVTFEGTVTQLAQAVLFQFGGSVTITGCRTSFILNLASLAKGATGRADIRAMNNNFGLVFSARRLRTDQRLVFTFSGSDLSGLVGEAPAALGYRGLQTAAFPPACTARLSPSTASASTPDYHASLTPLSVTIDAAVTGGTLSARPLPSVRR